MIACVQASHSMAPDPITQATGQVRRLVAPVTRYTRFVSVSKRFLWVLIAAMIALVVWIASDNNGENGARIVFSNVPKSEVIQNIMASPRYQGVDVHGRPYTVVAHKAVQVDKENVTMETIKAEITLDSGAWLAMNAGSGHMNIARKQMLLEGGVDAFYEGGYEFRSDHAQVDIQNNSIFGDAPVEGQGPLGTLKADNFSVENHGQVIRFNGSVRMKLYR